LSLDRGGIQKYAETMPKKHQPGSAAEKQSTLLQVSKLEEKLV